MTDDSPSSPPGKPVQTANDLAKDEEATRIATPARFVAAEAHRTMQASPTSILQPGQLLAHTYEIEEFIARGGMGEVYRARHIDVGSEHAIKVILPELANNPAILKMFTEEARKLRMVRNDAVVAYDGMFRDEHGLRYLVMEFAAGVPLSKTIAERPLQPQEVRKLRDRLAQGIAAAHDCEIYHRDISPDNIILVEGRVERAKIIDFGIAKAGGAGEQTIIGSDFAGKYSYVAPEQLGMFGGVVDARSDIYSLALVLIAAARGRSLPMGNSPATAVEARRHVPDLSGLPPDLAAELRPMLEPDPVDRPRSIRELGNLPPSRARSPAIAKPATTRKTFWIGVPALAFVALAASGIALYLHRQENAENAPRPSVSPTPQSASAPPAVPQPSDATRVLDRALIAEKARAIITNFSTRATCAELTLGSSEADNFDVKGVASTSEDLAGLRQELQAIPGVQAVNLAVTAYALPHCEVIKLLQQTGALSRLPSPRLELNQSSLIYRAGEKLVVRATAPIDGYLYVDFYDNAGQVVHLQADSQSNGIAVKAGQVVVLGSDQPHGNQPSYEISEPFGPNLIVAMASRTPLMSRRETVEAVQLYLAALDRAFAAADAKSVTSAFVQIETIPR